MRRKLAMILSLAGCMVMAQNFTLKSQWGVDKGVQKEEGTNDQGCLVTPFGAYSEDAFFPNCNGSTELITFNGEGHFGENSLVWLTVGVNYALFTDIQSAYITISNEEGTEVLTSGYG